MNKRRLAGLLSAAALVAGLGLAGSTTGAAAEVKSIVPLAALPTITPAGSWTLTLDWYCDGTVGTSLITFAADGSWSSVNGTAVRSGRWIGGGGTITWTYSDVADLIYTAQINGGFMTGVHGYNYSGGATGCFGGVLTAAATTSAATSAKKAATETAVTPG
ncbi:hypothetical protein [Actinoplanes sp. NPDC051851]|uniref:hypothetical protein n=1 Tax=Actinoplanes sp. NPDC051851 TaxID=3154753 RepID=UPI00343259E1